jgi:uncharacterized YigZ family protein
MESDTYKTIVTYSQGIYKEKGSRFIAMAYPVTSPEEIKSILAKIRKEHFNAKHHCYAYMLGLKRLTWRVNDDGEPSGTAGKPILGQINSYNLTNILIVVSRYFGGTLLGVSGLINAYRAAAATAIKNAEITEQTIQKFYELTFPYSSANDVMRIIKEENTGQSHQNFDLTCTIIVNFRLSAGSRILNRFSRIEGLKYKHIDTR